MTTVSRPEFEALQERVSSIADVTSRHLNITGGILDEALKLDGRVETLNGRIGSMESRVEALGGRMSDIARRMTRIEEQSDNIQRGIDSIEQHMTRFDERIKELPSLIATQLASPNTG